MKVYKCYVCNKELVEKPIRITIKKYGIGKYKQYSEYMNIDLCKKHYAELLKNMKNMKNT